MCPLDLIKKQSKFEYLAEVDRLSITNYYETIEISLLGHFQLASIETTSPFHYCFQVYC